MSDDKYGNINDPQSFAKRTRYILDLYKEHKDKPDEKGKVRDYSVTALLNSMMGLYNVFYENYEPDIAKELTGKKLSEYSWLEGKKACKQEGGKLCFDDDAYRYVSNLRNAIAHNNIQSISSQNQIVGLRMWNKPKRNSKKVIWMTVVSIKELEEIIQGFSEFAGNLVHKRVALARKPEIIDQVEDMQKFLDNL